jgi:hypothetical protein
MQNINQKILKTIGKYYMDKNTVRTNDGRIFKYNIDPSGMLANYSSISTDVNRKPIEGEIKLITEDIIKKMILNEELVKELDGKTWNYEYILGKYFDNEGTFYYALDDFLYPFIYSSKYLCKNFNEF